jgi:hypothetical protein
MRRASQYCFLERHIGFGPHLDFPFFDSEPKRDAANEQHPAFEGERTNECVMDGDICLFARMLLHWLALLDLPTGVVSALLHFLRLHPFPPLRAFCFRPFSMSLTAHPTPSSAAVATLAYLLATGVCFTLRNYHHHYYSGPHSA